MQLHLKAIVSVVLTTVAALATPAVAQGLGGGLNIAMPGIGLQPETLLTERFGIRGALDSNTLRDDHEETSARYDGKFPFGTSYLLADWHPYANGFRLSGGLAYNAQRLGSNSALSVSSSGARYSTTHISTFDTRARYSRATPYLGVGWGLAPSSRSGLYFSADVGVMYQRPSANLAGACAAALSPSMCTQLQSDLRADESEYREAMDESRFYPVISVGFGLRF